MINPPPSTTYQLPNQSQVKPTEVILLSQVKYAYFLSFFKVCVTSSISDIGEAVDLSM